MSQEQKLPAALLGLRVSVFLVMLMWTLDKFVRSDHAAKVFSGFYFLSGWGKEAFLVIGALELGLLLGFLAGFKKRLTYGLVLVFHAVSTLSSYKQYLSPFEGGNLLFFAAWPMLVACGALGKFGAFPPETPRYEPERRWAPTPRPGTKTA
mgnify:CR=1 FL=1